MAKKSGRSSAHYVGVHHPALVTGDGERTIRFWRDLLGMALVHTRGGPGDRQLTFVVGKNSFLVFFEWPGVEPLPMRRHGDPRSGAVVFDHVAIGVKSKKRLWEIVARLDAANFPVSDMVDHGTVYSIYSYDPNGIPIEFNAPVPGIDLRRRPLLEDILPSPVRLEGSAPVPGHWPAPEPIALEDRVIVAGEGAQSAFVLPTKQGRKKKIKRGRK